MNTENESRQDNAWKALLAHSAPTFAGDAVPPFGFITSTLARLNSERSERELLERIGLRALFASLAILIAVAGVTVGVGLQEQADFDPAIKSALQWDTLPIS